MTTLCSHPLTSQTNIKSESNCKQLPSMFLSKSLLPSQSLPMRLVLSSRKEETVQAASESCVISTVTMHSECLGFCYTQKNESKRKMCIMKIDSFHRISSYMARKGSDRLNLKTWIEYCLIMPFGKHQHAVRSC